MKTTTKRWKSKLSPPCFPLHLLLLLRRAQGAPRRPRRRSPAPDRPPRAPRPPPAPAPRAAASTSPGASPSRGRAGASRRGVAASGQPLIAAATKTAAPAEEHGSCCCCCSKAASEEEEEAEEEISERSRAETASQTSSAVAPAPATEASAPTERRTCGLTSRAGHSAACCFVLLGELLRGLRERNGRRLGQRRFVLRRFRRRRFPPLSLIDFERRKSSLFLVSLILPAAVSRSALHRRQTPFYGSVEESELYPVWLDFLKKKRTCARLSAAPEQEEDEEAAEGATELASSCGARPAAAE